MKSVELLKSSRRRYYKFTAIDDCTGLRIVRIERDRKRRAGRGPTPFPDQTGDRGRQPEKCGRVNEDGRPGSWYTACSAGRRVVAVAGGSPVPRLRA